MDWVSDEDRDKYAGHALSRASLCSSLIKKIRSNRERIVVAKSICFVQIVSTGGSTKRKENSPRQDSSNRHNARKLGSRRPIHLSGN